MSRSPGLSSGFPAISTYLADAVFDSGAPRAPSGLRTAHCMLSMKVPGLAFIRQNPATNYPLPALTIHRIAQHVRGYHRRHPNAFSNPCRKSGIVNPAKIVVVDMTSRVFHAKPMDSSAFPSLHMPRTLTRRASISVALLIALAVMPAAANSGGWGWETKKIDGREHVSADSIMKFYNFRNVSRSGKMHILENPDRPRIEIRLEIGGHTCLMNNVKFVLSHPVIEEHNKVWVSRVDLSKLIDPVLRPSFIANAGNFNTVILDPGHGGKDPGARNSLGTEAFYNLKLAGLTKGKLEARGFRVIMTRTSDRFLSLQERVTFANSVQENAVFISIHFNAGGSHARGIETFTLSPPGVSHYGRGLRADDFRARAGNQQDSANIALATALHGSALTRLGANTFDRGIKRARFNVLSGVRHPAVLFEGGFMSNPQDARLIHNDRYQDALATAIADAVMRYRAAVSRSPATNQARGR